MADPPPSCCRLLDWNRGRLALHRGIGFFSRRTKRVDIQAFCLLEVIQNNVSSANEFIQLLSVSVSHRAASPKMQDKSNKQLKRERRGRTYTTENTPVIFISFPSSPDRKPPAAVRASASSPLILSSRTPGLLRPTPRPLSSPLSEGVLD